MNLGSDRDEFIVHEHPPITPDASCRRIHHRAEVTQNILHDSDSTAWPFSPVFPDSTSPSFIYLVDTQGPQ